MNLKGIAYKLQTALCKQGRYIKINQYQSYSNRKERMVTKYVLTEKIQCDDGKMRDFPILESYQMVDIVKKLASMLDNGGG